MICFPDLRAALLQLSPEFVPHFVDRCDHRPRGEAKPHERGLRKLQARLDGFRYGICNADLIEMACVSRVSRAGHDHNVRPHQARGFHDLVDVLAPRGGYDNRLGVLNPQLLRKAGLVASPKYTLRPYRLYSETRSGSLSLAMNGNTCRSRSEQSTCPTRP